MMQKTKVLSAFIERGHLYIKVEKTLEYSAGQYFFIEYKGVRRPYSAASSPLEKEMLFLIKLRNGQMSNLIKDIKEGENISIEGPVGNFTYAGKKQVFFAAGSGIAPIRGILKDMELREIGDGTLFYSCREDYFPFMEELLGFKKSRAVLTITGNAPEGWKYEKGRIGAELVNKYKDSWDIAYICGPGEFAKAMKEIALGQGIKELRIETWG